MRRSRSSRRCQSGRCTATKSSTVTSVPPKESYALGVAEPFCCPGASTRMGDIYSLDAPESVAVGYDVAGVGSRFLAALIDALVLAVVLAALVIVTVLAGQSLTGTMAYVAAGVGVLIINVVLLGYFVFFEIIWNGQSPGKRAMGLRVVKTSGYPITA